VLALNQFDQVSHFLRAVVIRDPQCSAFQNDLKSTPEQRAIRDRCENFLGPNQPGITTPDVQSDSQAQQAGFRREKTKPKPGQTDWSKPHPTLPASQQDLLQHYGAPTGVPSAPAPSSSSAPTGGAVTNVLDYLLAR
jgi:hypothetical protein